MSLSEKEAMDRLFVAVHLPADVSSRIQEWTAGGQSKCLSRKWVHPQDYHITVQFLGDTPTHRVGRSWQQRFRRLRRSIIHSSSVFMMRVYSAQWPHLEFYGQELAGNCLHWNSFSDR